MPTEFASPVDVYGRGGLMLDKAGQPIVPEAVRTIPYDSPYELNLSRKAVRTSSVYGTPSVYDVTTVPNNVPNPIDKPFSPAELERILRMYDVDAANLPSRLGNLLSSGTPANVPGERPGDHRQL